MYSLKYLKHGLKTFKGLLKTKEREADCEVAREKRKRKLARLKFQYLQIFVVQVQ